MVKPVPASCGGFGKIAKASVPSGPPEFNLPGKLGEQAPSFYYFGFYFEGLKTQSQNFSAHRRVTRTVGQCIIIGSVVIIV